ncbi:MAG: iron-containing alcohol dehydrogenase [Clostridia bacterium]|nr:iron-containing alcohol dehydrogenase [Clostridia bacterium]
MASYNELFENAPAHLKADAVLRFPGACSENSGIVISCGCAMKAGQYAKNLGAHKVILVADKILRELGMLAPVTDSLDKEGIAYTVFCDIHPEPHSEDLTAAENCAKEFGADAVVGVGGGSSLDVAKVTACVLSGNDNAIDIITNKVKTFRSVPLVLLPTTSGTGSEVSPYAVASHNGKKVFISSPQALPDVALVDPLMTATMPAKVTAFTGLDALTHAVEGVCGCTNPFTKALAVQAVELVFNYLPKAVANPEDLEARTRMCYASVLGMMAYTQGGGLYAHSASYILTLSKNAPHGLGCGLTLPYTLAFNMEVIEELLESFIPSITKSGIAAPATAKDVPDAFLALVKAVNAPATIAELGYTEADVEAFANSLFTDYYRAKNPKKVESGTELKALVQRMYSGKITF